MTAHRPLLRNPRPHRLALALAASSLLTLPLSAQVLPSGASVAAGQAQIAVSGANMTVTNTANTILNWNSFSIGAQNAVRFQQPNAASQVLNRVTGSDPSSILGQLSSNGKVWLLNPNGVLFGQGARIDVGGLVTSTLRLNDADWLAGRYAFSAGAPGATVRNQGELRSTLGGRVVLLGGSVRNEGLIDAPGGQVLLAAGDSMELIDTGAPHLTVRLNASQGEALNLGSLRASGGRIDVHAAVVNQQGLVQADALSAGPGGEIVLQAKERLSLAGGSVTSATAQAGQGGDITLLGREVGLFGNAHVDASGASGGGQVRVGGGLQGRDTSVPNADAVYFGRDATIKADATTQGDGGRVILWSDHATRAFGSLSARGGAQGGDGGFIETSGGWLDARPLAVDVGAASGKPGQWLLDPYDIFISDGVSDNGYDASFTAIGNAQISSATITTALNAGTNVTVSTGTGGPAGQGTISVNFANIQVNAVNPGSLTLIADADIDMYGSTIASNGGAMPVSLLAGRSGSGGIAMESTSIRTAGGNLLLGGFGTGLNPDDSIFANAATSGVLIRQNSLLNAGTGRIEINASNAGGSAINMFGTSNATGADIVLRGYSTGTPNGAAISISDSELKATHSLLLSGRGVDTGVSIWSSFTPANLEVVPAIADSTAALTLIGRSESSAAEGVEVVSSTNLPSSSGWLRVENGAALTISGTNTSTDPQSGAAAVRLSSALASFPLLISGSSGGPISVSTFGVGNWMSVDAFLLADGNTLTMSTDRRLSLFGAQLSAAGIIDLRASQIDVGAATISSSSQGEAIWLRGPGTTSGLDLLEVSDGDVTLSTPNGRWIVWGRDVLQTSIDGSLAYDFKRYGVSGGTGWAGDVGNGFVFSTGQTAAVDLAVLDKVYDGTTAATLSGGSASGVNGDFGSLASSATAAFIDKNAGTGKTVSLTDTNLFTMTDSNGKPVYGYTFTGNGSASITPAPLSATVTANNKVYDATTAATVNVSAITGLIGNETVAVNTQAAFGDKNVGTGKTLSGVQFSLADGGNGGLASNYFFNAPNQLYQADITPLFINVSGIVAANKVYDATTNASLSGSAGLTALAGDQLTLSGTALGQFSDKNVGTGKTVVLTGLSLSGADAGNYLLTSSGIQADITPLSISVSGLAAANKVYDATTNASLSGSAGITALAGDQLTLGGTALGQFSDKNVGTGKTVVLTGLSLGGADAGNYLLTSSGLQADITPAQLLYVADAATRVLGTPSGGLSGQISGFVGGETQADATTGTLSFSASPSATTVGTHAIEGSGLSAQNYQFSQAAGNAQALQLLPPLVDGGGASADLSVHAALQTLQLPGPPTSPLNSGLADISSALPSPSAGSGSASALASASASDFGSVRLASLSPGDLQGLLDARDRYKKTLFSESISKLEQDPSLADMQPCASLGDAASGNCMVTAALKAQAQAEGAASASAPAAPAVAAATPAAPAATAPAAAAATAAAATPAPVAPPAPALLSKRRVQTASLPQIERKVALVIGVNRYADPRIPQLGNAVGDAQALGRLFESRLGYETVTLENASKASVVAALNRLALELGPRDSVLVYYAGHGELIESTGQGYWQLTDSDAKKPESWLSNADIARLVQQIGASQVALISDSCYSGSLADGERIRATPGQLDAGQLLTHKAVVAMSSGGNEPVFDAGKGGHSPFAWSLMQSLGQVSNWQPGGNVFERVRFAVARELPQRPRYGAAAGHQRGGDYLFEQRQLEQRN